MFEPTAVKSTGDSDVVMVLKADNLIETVSFFFQVKKLTILTFQISFSALHN